MARASADGCGAAECAGPKAAGDRPRVNAQIFYGHALVFNVKVVPRVGYSRTQEFQEYGRRTLGAHRKFPLGVSRVHTPYQSAQQPHFARCYTQMP